MSQATRDDILQALATVIDPETGRDVVSEGRVQGLVVRGSHAGFAIEVSAQIGEAGEPLRQACEQAALGVSGIEQVTAVLTAHREAPSTAAQAPASRRTGPPPQSQGQGHVQDQGHGHSHDHDHGSAKGQSGAPAASRGGGALTFPNIKNIVAVASGKGGVGKSTVAVNLALGLRAIGLKVGLMDADIYGPSVPAMLGLTGQPESGTGGKLAPKDRFGIKAMSMGLLVDPDTPMIWRGPMVQSAITQLLSDVDWGELDVLIVDMPPGTGDAQLTLAQKVPLSGAVIVSTPQEIALIDARKGLAMFRKTHVPILGVIENMAWLEMPDGSRNYVFGQGGARRTADELGSAFLGEVPLDPAIRETSDAGEPIVVSRPESAQAAAFIEISSKVAETLTGASAARPAPTIVIED